MASTIPHAAVYAGYFAALAVLLSFLPAHLSRLDFTGKQIALVMAFLPVMASVAPLVWGYLADRLQRRLLMLRLA